MSGLVFRPIGPVEGALVVLDADRRLYAGLSRQGDYWHVVSPALEDMANADGAVIRRAGQLICRCRGGLFRGTCYRVEQAEAFEAGQASRFESVPPDWLVGLDSPFGAGEAVEASRG
ncbi:MAG: hypothetical protein AB1627_01175 [Chloroflexota bacterium]